MASIAMTDRAPADSLGNSETHNTAVRGQSLEGAIAVRGVTKIYGSGSRAIRALPETSFRVDASDFVSVLGPSGCGKTTLLKVIGDIIEPSTGQVLIDGQPSSQMRCQQRIGYVFQSPLLLPWRIVRRNVSLPFEVAGECGRLNRIPKDVAARVDSVLDTVGLSAFSDRLPHELSGGMQSRVSLARALVTEPSVLLMDEPFAALDELTRTAMALHLLDVWERVRTTVVFITHHIEEAVLLSNRILVMSERPGRICRDISIDLPRPRSLETRREPAFRATVEDLLEYLHRREWAAS
jgi:NitT/TauT family transport system ATP-binding protein